MIPPDAHPYCCRCRDAVEFPDESAYVHRYLVALDLPVLLCLWCGESVGKET